MWKLPAGHTVPLMLVLALSLTATAAGQAPAPRQCFNQADLKGRSEERRIVRNVADAYAPLPVGRLQDQPLPSAWRGVIRRVALPPNVKQIALTFDLCEVANEIAGYDSAIVDYLRALRVRATFFAGGKWIVSHGARARQMLADPLFEVGNHTWEHRNLRLLRGQRLKDEIAGAQLAYSGVYRQLVEAQCLAPDRQRQLPGLSLPPGQPYLLRFPFGACDGESLRAVADAGLLAIQWDVSSGDPSHSVTPEQMAAAVLREARSGSIVLFHANGRGWHTAEALRLIVPRLRAQGYTLVTVTDLLSTPGAKPEFSDTCYDSRPGDTERYDALARHLDRAAAAFKARYAPSAGPRSDSTLVPPEPVPATRPLPRAATPRE